jgi:hypothetical protein
MQAQHPGPGCGRVLRRFATLLAAAVLVAPAPVLFAPPVLALGTTPSATTLYDYPVGTSAPGEEVGYSAVITPLPSAMDSGTVAFSDGGTAISGCESVAVILNAQLGGDTTASARCTRTYDTAGSHSVTAVYSGTATLASSTSDPVSHEVQASVTKSDQIIAFTSTAPSGAEVGGPTYTPAATGGDSGNPIVFTIDASASSVCSIDGQGVVSFTGAGNCTIVATQAGNDDYNPAPQAQQSFTVSAAAPPDPTFYVTQVDAGAGDCSSWANACDSVSLALSKAGSGDQIRVAAGTYVPDPAGLSDPRTATFQLKTGVALYGGFPGAGGDMASRDPAANVTVLSGDLDRDDGPNFASNGDNAYHVVTGSGTDASAILDGFTVTAGNANVVGSEQPNYGGGMLNVSGSPTVRNVTFTRNTGWSVYGAGMYNDHGNPSLADVTFSGNLAANGHGGGIADLSSSPTLTNVTFSGNTATHSGAVGGGMFNQVGSSPTLTNVTFSGNVAYTGGGGMGNWYSSSPTLTNVTFSGNATNGDPSVNSSGLGGGMDNEHSSSPTLANVTFSGNTASSAGGGMENFSSSSPTLTNVTFSGNTAVYEGGAINNEYSSPVVTNSILWGNSAGSVSNQIANDHATPTLRSSDIRGSGGSGAAWNGALGTDGGSNIDADPVLGQLGDHGAGIPTLPLLPGSAAIDAANAGTCPATDERGVTRPQGSGCDMGAVEARPFTLVLVSGDQQTAAANAPFANPLVVTVSGDDPVTGGRVTFRAPDPEAGPSATFSGNPATIGADGTASLTAIAGTTSGTYTVSASTAGGANTVDFSLTNGSGVLFAKPDGAATGTCGSWSHACTLSYALRTATSGDEVWASAGTYAPDVASQTDPGDPRSATFQLESGVAVYGGFAGTETTRGQRSPATNVTILSGDLGVTGVSGDNAYHVVTASGTDATAVLDGFTVSGGNADGDSPNDGGGGLYADSGSPTLTHVTFSHNAAVSAGGGIGSSGGSPILTDVTFSSNSAQMGAGIYAYAGSPTLTNATFSGNTAGSSGGGVFIASSNEVVARPTLTNVTFAGNAAGFDGGGFDNEGGSPTLTRVTFSDNTATQLGGGMWSIGGDLTLTDVTFSGNSSRSGGGIGVVSISSAFTNVTFSGNSATMYGGGMMTSGGDLTLTNVTFNGNSAPTGGAMHNSRGSQPTVTNGILWGDGGGEVVNVANGRPEHQTRATFRNSDIQGSGGSGASWNTGLGTDGGGNIDADPLLGTLGTYPASAKTQTLPLLPGSAAIDAADGATCPATDQRGVARPRGAGCDMGAYEAPAFTMSISGGNRQGAQPNAAFDEPLEVTVGGSGDPVAGGHVTFTAPDSGASAIVTGSPATIGADGTASVTATANETLGAYEVIASSIGANSVSFNVRNGGILHATPGGATEGECDSWESACSLSHALSLALSGCQVWVATGAYTPTWRTDPDDPRTATFRVASGARLYGGFVGGETSLDARDPATNVTTLSGDLNGDDGADFANNGDNAYQVVTGVNLAATTTIDGVTIRGGNASTWVYQGGGMYVTGSPTLTDVTFALNTALDGGGMWSAGSPTLTDVAFNGNSTTGGRGGGLYIGSGSPTLTDVTFTGNSAGGGWGGGMYSSGQPWLTRVAFNDNAAARGGGMVNEGDANLTDVSFSGDTADIGGGLASMYGLPVLQGVTFNGNTASGNGGGLWADRSSPRLTNVTFADNSAGASGGALFQGTNASVYAAGHYNLVNTYLTNVTFAGNSAVQHGGAIIAYGGRVTVRGSILWGDTAGTGGAETYADTYYSSSVTATHSDIQGGYGGTANINVDPLIGPLGGYGGFVQTLPLLPGSPAIDTIAPDAYPSGSGSRCGSDVTLDARGVVRPQGASCDMGAYETRPFTLTVSGGDNQTAVVNTAFAHPLEVTVTSASGDPVAGGNVTFTAPDPTGASATLDGSPATIGSDGTASVTATANGTEGDYTVSASAAGATNAASFSLANTTVVAPSLTLLKTLTLDNGGTALVTDWTLTATGTGLSPTNLSGTTPVSSDATFKADTYTLAESGGPSGYTPGAWSCTNGVVVTAGQISLANGQTTTCTIDNDDQPGTLVIVKHVINDNGGTKVAGNFSITVTGTNVAPSATFPGAESPGTTVTLNAGSYSVDEAAVFGYAKTIGANCSGTIANGATKTCTITNDDIQPKLTLTKVLSPASDPGRFNLQIGGTTYATNVGNGGSTGAVGLNAGTWTVGETGGTIPPTSLANYTTTYGGDCAANGSISLTVGQNKTCTITNIIKDADGDNIPDFLDCSSLFDNRVVDPSGTLAAYLPASRRHATLQAAVIAAADNDVITMYANTVENVIIGTTTGSGGKDLRIVGCGHKITGALAANPVITVQVSAGANDGNTGAGEADIHIEDLSVLKGSTGFLVQTSKASSNNTSTLLKSIRSDQNGPSSGAGNPTVANPGHGVKIEGDGNEVRGANSIGTNSGDGIQVIGNSNLLNTNRITSNKGDGIDVTGKANTVVANKVGEQGIGNKGNGILVTCPAATPNCANTLTENDVFGNTLLGIKVTGNMNLVYKNDVGEKNKGNLGGGILITGDSNLLGQALDENNVFANTGVGIAVVGNSNRISRNDVGDTGKGNTGDGINVRGSGNVVDLNSVFASGGDGIDVAGGTSLKSNLITNNIVGDRGKGNLGDGIVVTADVGNGTAAPVEIAGNTVRSNKLYGIHVTAAGHQLANNVSGGTGSYASGGQDNGKFEFLVTTGNFNAGGNVANGTTIPGAVNSAFPTVGQGTGP